MLDEFETSLITAAVDGQLSPAESRAFEALLARSHDAGTLFSALQRDRNQLAALPRLSAPPRLAESVFAALDGPIVPARPVPRPARSRWIPATMAASFLVAVASGTYWFVSGSGSPRLVHKQMLQLPRETLAPAPRETPQIDRATEQTPKDILEVFVEPTTVADGLENPKIPPESLPGVERPTSNPDRILAAPIGSELKAFDRVDIELPTLAAFGDLSNEEVCASLVRGLTRNSSTRVDLFARDAFRAAELLVAAGKSHNLAIQIETFAAERMKRKFPSAWWIYTDALTPDEIAKWLASAATLDAGSTPSDRAFGNFHAIAGGAVEQRDALALAGIDLGIGKKSPQPGAHISSKTIDEVAGALQKGETTKSGLLLTYLPQLVRVHPLLSRDIKQFHEQRKDRKAGTVPLVIVVRPSP